MAKRLTTEEKLTRLGEIGKNPLSEEGIQEIRKSLSSANNIIVAKAAKIVAKCHITELLPNLAEAFDRFIKKPAKTDKGCFAKTAIIQALDSLEYNESELFLQGIHYVQMEPVYGGQQDTAAELRGKCVFALARIEPPEVFFELTPLLTDSELQPRIAAVKALTYLVSEKSELLLRLKILTGDKAPQVLHECFAGLMSIEPSRSMDFVAKYLNSPDLLIAEGAALALGESREPQAFHILRNHWKDSINHEFQEMLLLPIALTRCDEAFEFLLDVIRHEYRDKAVGAVRALKVYDDNHDQRKRIYQTVLARDDAKISETYANEFGSPSFKA
jgi:HEAT repeat protein